MYIYIQILFHYRLLQDTEYSSPCYTANPYCLSIFYKVVQLSHSSCLTLCDPMSYSTSGFPVHHHFLELAQTHVHRVSDAIQQSHSVVLFSSCLQSFPASGSFPRSQIFASGGQNIGVSASALVLPMNTQD